MSQKDLILLLHNGALKFLGQAKEELAKENTEVFADRIERTHRIVQHLYTTLDFEAGGDIAEKLGSLYSFIISQLYIVNSTRSVDIIDDLTEVISNLKEGWQYLGSEIPADIGTAAARKNDITMEKALSVQV
ncbi:MAG: flagellar export chaperone FliS [candidate division Zixibacteria bacterium]|nr:flagellar export chaperone FliS [candidate division Zixibacteria bacterium]MBU2625489.1 flagellar export chaperone FliS [candidate division Zixibacteria bacterium]